MRPLTLLPIFCALLWAGLQNATAYPLTEEQQARLERYLPKSYAKLQRTEPFHVVLIGDGVSRKAGPGNQEGIHGSMHGTLLAGLEAEFFYTGGVRVLNPLSQNPQKLRDHIGPEITMEHFTEPGAIGLNALQHLSTNALLNQPDLVIIHLGLNDAYTGSLIDVYENALKEAMRICKEANSEVILIGPTLLNDDINTVGWGLTRRYAAAARRVAEEFRTMFLDPGLALAEGAAVPMSGEPKARSLSVSQSLELEIFNHGATFDEDRYINSAAQEKAGQALFRQFLDGLPKPKYDLFASALYTQPNDLRVSLNLTNRSQEPVQGVIGVLNIGQSWEPENAYLPFRLGTGERKAYPVVYRRRVKEGPNGDPVFFREEGNDLAMLCSALISDLDGSQLVETEAVMSPVSVQWDYSALKDQQGSFPVKFTISNPSPDPISGTYQFTFGKQRATKAFNLGPLEARQFSAICRLPDEGILREKRKVQLQIETGNHRLVFDREAEATEDLGLGQISTLVREDEYEVTDDRIRAGSLRQRVTMTPRADAQFLELTFDVANVDLETAERMSSVMLEIGVDARPGEETQSFGFIKPLQIAFQPGRDFGVAAPIGVAAFGNGYDKRVDSRGIASTLKSARDGKNHQFVVRIPRVYLYRHGWSLGASSSTLGLSARLKFLRVNTATGKFEYPRDATWVTNDPALHPYNPAGLVTLELNERPSGWSVRLY